jgi:hypothetical protein
MIMLYNFQDLQHTIAKSPTSTPEESSVRKALAIVTCLFILAALPRQAAAAATLTFDKPVHQFGTIIQGNTVTHSFTFRNTGTATVTINRIGSSCGCTVANVSHRIILPGKQGAITASFDSADFSGHVSKEIFVFLDNPAKPAHTLFMEGTVKEELVATPQQLSLGTVKAGIQKVVVLKLENQGKTPARIKEIRTGLPQTTISIGKRLLKPGESTTVTLAITPRTDSRFINNFLTITLEGLSKKEKSISIFGTIQK